MTVTMPQIASEPDEPFGLAKPSGREPLVQPPVVVAPVDPLELSYYEAVRLVVHVLTMSGFVLLPSDNCYAVAALPNFPRAIALVDAVTEHSAFPITLVCADVAQPWEWIITSSTLQRIAAKFWPGPLTIVGKVANALAAEAAAYVHTPNPSDPSLGIRVSKIGVERSLTGAANMPLTTAALHYPDGTLVRDYCDAVDLVYRRLAAHQIGRVNWAAVRTVERFRFDQLSTVIALDTAGRLRVIREGFYPAAAIRASLDERGPDEDRDVT
jgi:tRNA A37 threonylcarbamoyladenosine synthetase subunit TsaC/SUA5/YrdC